jgi:hypothetical protein
MNQYFVYNEIIKSYDLKKIRFQFFSILVKKNLVLSLLIVFN